MIRTRMHRIVRLATIAALLASLIGVGVTARPASAADYRIASWPALWRNPVTGQLGGTVDITTNFGALGTGCSNVDTAHRYTQDPSRFGAHLGVNIAATTRASGGTQTTVRAAAGGTVIYRGPKWGTNWGDVVMVQSRTVDGSIFVTTYGHLISTLEPNQILKAGDVIGIVTQTGWMKQNGYSPRLHLGLRPGTGTSEMRTIADARIAGSTKCDLSKNTVGMVDPLKYLNIRLPTGTRVAIFGVANKRFVRAEYLYPGNSWAMMRSFATTPGTFDRFFIAGNCKSTLGCTIKSAAMNRFVSVEVTYAGTSKNMLRARAGTAGPLERFGIVGDCAVRCTLVSRANGRIVAAELGYTGASYGMLRARSTTAGGWEAFTLRKA